MRTANIDIPKPRNVYTPKDKLEEVKVKLEYLEQLRTLYDNKFGMLNGQFDIKKRIADVCNSIENDLHIAQGCSVSNVNVNISCDEVAKIKDIINVFEKMKDCRRGV